MRIIYCIWPFKKNEMKTLKTEQGKTIEIEVLYDLGGWNYFTGVLERRGYYLHCTPILISRDKDGKVRNRVYTAFTGIKHFLLEVKRKSKKAEKEAIELAKDMEDELIDYVCKKNGLTIKKEIKETT